MRIVMQCAGTKHPPASTFVTDDGCRVAFVADPSSAPKRDGVLHAHPDDPSDHPKATWRDRVVAENRRPTSAPRLVAAGRLYAPKAYATLERHFGTSRLFILSAGWGLVRADFLLPDYDITFSKSAETWKRRSKWHRFDDFNALSAEPEDDTVFLGGTDYTPLFAQLTRSIPGRRLVIFRSKAPPDVPGCATKRYCTPRRTTWYYECAEALVSGSLVPSFDPA